MSVKDNVLSKLEESKGTYISGEQLAEALSVSRNSVWKAVKSLQEDGYKIVAVTNKGYCLTKDNDIFSTKAIEKHLPQNSVFQCEVHKEVSSTNDLARIYAHQGASEGLVVIAENQSGGKGRLGRKFHSPTGTGIYMSLLLRPTIPSTDSLSITTAAAVAVARAIEKVTGEKARIKWVNDIFCRKKKVCGILTEASFSLEGGHLEYAILGIGVNVMEPVDGFPKELQGIAGSVLTSAQNIPEVRSMLVANILQEFWGYYQNLSKKEFLQEYRERSLIIGKDIWVVNGEDVVPAQALSINDACELEVAYKDGTHEVLSCGEVSIKPIL